MFQFSDQFNTLSGEGLRLVLIEKFPGDRVMLPFYYYDILSPADAAEVGKISIRIGHNYHSYYNGHIGYEIGEPWRGRGFALRACRLVLPVARSHGMDYLHLTCREDNAPSYKTIEKLGAELVEIVTPPRDYFAWQEGMGRQRIYRLDLKGDRP